MTLNFKTMPYSNNKYHFTEPFLVYDLSATVNHNGSVFTEHLIKAEETLRSKRAFVPWHWLKWINANFISFIDFI